MRQAGMASLGEQRLESIQAVHRVVGAIAESGESDSSHVSIGHTNVGTLENLVVVMEEYDRKQLR